MKIWLWRNTWRWMPSVFFHSLERILQRSLSSWVTRLKTPHVLQIIPAVVFQMQIWFKWTFGPHFNIFALWSSQGRKQNCHTKYVHEDMVHKGCFNISKELWYSRTIQDQSFVIQIHVPLHQTVEEFRIRDQNVKKIVSTLSIPQQETRIHHSNYLSE